MMKRSCLILEHEPTPKLENRIRKFEYITLIYLCPNSEALFVHKGNSNQILKGNSLLAETLDQDTQLDLTA